MDLLPPKKWRKSDCRWVCHDLKGQNQNGKQQKQWTGAGRH